MVQCEICKRQVFRMWKFKVGCKECQPYKTIRQFGDKRFPNGRTIYVSKQKEGNE